MTVCPGQRRPDSMGVKTYLRVFELLIKLLHCVVSNLHGCHNLYCLHQNLPQFFAETMSPMYLWLFWESIAETLILGFSTCWSNFVNSGLNSVGQCWMLYIVFGKYFKGLYCKSNDLGWFARFRIQFLPDHIMIHSCLVCVFPCNSL